MDGDGVCVSVFYLETSEASNHVQVVASGCAGWSSFHRRLRVRMLQSLSQKLLIGCSCFGAFYGLGQGSLYFLVELPLGRGFEVLGSSVRASPRFFLCYNWFCELGGRFVDGCLYRLCTPFCFL
jgi:hypothetical protein